MSTNSTMSLYDLSKYPFLPWINSVMLMSTPKISPAVQTPSSIVAQQQSIFSAFTRPKYFGPSTKIALLFGVANGLGGYMIYDGDMESGSGFLAAWNALYILVGGRGSIKALKYGKAWPLLLTVTAGTNGVLYTRRFINSGF